MAILGAHMSIAGGYYKSVEAAAEASCDCVQLFTKNNNQWRAKAITDDDAKRFRDAMDAHEIDHPISHASYLINLASPDDELWSKSIDAMVVELQRADLLGIPYVIVHPGSFTTSSEEEGISRIAEAFNEIHRNHKRIKAVTLLENTAGQGTNLGWQFEQLAAMLKKIKSTRRMGVCIDTCHAFAAGYDMSTPAAYRKTIKSLDDNVGIERVRAFHLNDSKKDLGSRVDRHEHIGRGQMGLDPFRHLLNDRRFANVPMYLETPKGSENERDLDQINLETLRGLIKPSKSTKRPKTKSQ